MSCSEAIDASIGREFDPRLIPSVSKIVGGRVRELVPAASLTTYAIGGAIRAVVTVESRAEAAEILRLLAAEGQPTRVFGFGSNLLVSDSGLNEWIIRLGASFKGIESLGAGEFELGGNASIMAVSRKLSEEGFAGLEFAAGIPASVGGAVFMNAGAHGGEICQRIVSVRGVLSDGGDYEWRGADLPWSYRRSGLPQGVLITSARIGLVRGDRDTIAKGCADNLAHRRRTQPLALPSAGSVFKNPSPDNPAGRVLEAAGMKGAKLGGAEVSTLHANWIVNPSKSASAADVRGLIELCAKRALEVCGVELEPEVRIWGR
ncbi:MAG: UDP-N-acetylmuramate dehydrogenase [Pseudomonadota bacterium]|jgi:UDP-N-acetylmuramate dehydrogenase